MIARLLARRRAGDDGGYALLFVLFVTTMIMVGTAATLTVTTGSIAPARQSQDDYAALAAAQSGVQDFVANLDAQCRSKDTQSCSWLRTDPTVAATIGDQSYSVHALNPTRYLDANGGTLRVVSTGRAGAGSGATSRTVTADLSGAPSILRFTYFSDYETLGTSFLDSYYGPRTITLSDPSVAAAVGLPTGSTVHWNGTSSAPRDGYTDGVCDTLYYDDPTNVTAAHATAAGRSTTRAARADLAVGTDFSEDGYTRTPAQQLLQLADPTASTKVSRDAACEVRFTKGMTFTGPVYSRDALLMTNGEVGSSSGPRFDVPAGETDLPPAGTGWSTAATPAAPSTGAPYRSDPLLGGTPTTASTQQVVRTIATPLSLPSRVAVTGTCSYTGPTRVVLSGTTATVTSPLTAAVPGDACYTSTSGGTGVVAAHVPVTSTIIRVTDAVTSLTGAAPSFPGLALGAGGDVTPYSTSRGDAYVEGALTTGVLSLVTSHDIVVTGDLTTTTTVGANAAGERSWTSGAAIDLVATNDVRVYHPVACASGSPTDGYCPNDISGLYSTTEAGLVVKDDGTLRATHPSLQYVNRLATPVRRIDAAVLALTGSFRVDNHDRGAALGTLTVDGGVYQHHRGATGVLWEVPTAAITGSRPSSGARLQITYLSLADAGLPYVPVLDTGASIASPWFVLGVSSGVPR